MTGRSAVTESNSNDTISTAVDIMDSLNMEVVMDEQQLSVHPSGYPDEFDFLHNLFKWTVRLADLLNGNRLLTLSVSPLSKAVEWQLTVQMRIHVAMHYGKMKIVDKDVFRFERAAHSMTVEIKSINVHFLRFEMRVINLVMQPLPALTDGDLTIHFPNEESPLRVSRDILWLLSDYLGNMAEQNEHVEVSDVSRNDFCELLYQVYPTGRPLDANLSGLAKAAVAFNCHGLIYALSKYLYDYNQKPMSLLEKFNSAIKNGLLPAAKQIVLTAVQCGYWDRWVAGGMNFEASVGKGVYEDIICPTVTLARSIPLNTCIMTNPQKPTDFLKPKHDGKHVKILLRQTPFYVNRGLFEALGTSKFYFVGEDEYVATFSAEMARSCRADNITPGKVLLAILHFLYPTHSPIPLECMKSAIVFCHDHNWKYAKGRIEQDVLEQPPENAEEYLEQLKFAEKFELSNMLRALLQRAEGSLFEMAKQLQQSDRLEELSFELRTAVRDRLCGGWALADRECNRLSSRLPTLHLHRLVLSPEQGEAAPEHGDMEMTLQSVNSDAIYGSCVSMLVLDE